MSDLAPSQSVDLPPDLVTAVQADLQSQLYGNLVISQATATFGAVVCAVLFFDGQPAVRVAAWVTYMVLVAMARLGWRARYRADGVHERSVRYWELSFMAGVAFSALGWGTAVVMFFDPVDVTRQLLLVVTVAAVAAGSIAHLSASFPAVGVMLSVTLLPLALMYARQPEGLGLAVLILLFFGVMLSIGWRNHATLRGNARLAEGNRRLVEQLTEHAAALETARSQDDAERELALSVFAAILPRRILEASKLSYHLSSQSAFNGDLLLVENHPDGRQHIMLGDFTGHGLAASLGAIPAADVFMSMTRKGFPLRMIVGEINRKLYTQLPANLFCAACLIEVDAAHSRLRVWNGGLPSVYLIRRQQTQDDRRVTPIHADHPPLGVLPPDRLICTPRSLAIDAGDLVFMATDGVTEQRDLTGDMFGDERLVQLLASATDAAGLADSLKRALATFSTGVEQGDDLTFVALRVGPEARLQARTLPDRGLPPASVQAADWRLRLELQAPALRRLDPVSLLSQFVGDLTAPAHDWNELDLVLGELYKNALEHGVLRLDSSGKHTDDGFEAYYRAREARLAALDDGHVTVELTHHRDPEGGVLQMTLRDSGSGFDHRAAGRESGEVPRLAHGRGLMLARSLCQGLEHRGDGSQVRATMRWRADG